MKARLDSPTIVEESPVQEILMVACLERRHAGSRYGEPFWSGHRIVVIRSGRVRLEMGERLCEVGPGTVLWFHGNEPVQGRVVEAPWTCYSLTFRAPFLPPPDYEERIRHLPKEKILARCKMLLETWLDTSVSPIVHLLRVQGRLMQLLADLTTPDQRGFRVGPETALWWQVENELRNDLSQSSDMHRMSQLARRSPSTITRSCRHAVGIPPLKRVKQMRMSLARSLVRMSSLTFTQVAERVGHGRLHEFSRDYHKQFGVPPTVDRERFAKHRKEIDLPAKAEGQTSPSPLSSPPEGRGNDFRQHRTKFPSPPLATNAFGVGAEGRVRGAVDNFRASIDDPPESTSHEWPKQVAASPILKVVFVARFELREPGRTHGEYSFPGHHIQLTKRGSVQIATCGRTYEVRPGGVIWFHSDEDFSIRITEAPWGFCNVSFIAPSLQPPDLDARYQARRPERIVPLYDAFYKIWRNLSLPPLERLLRVQAALLDFLAELMSGAPKRTHVDQEAALWWQVEAELRKNLHRPVSLRLMSQLAKRSPTTITRACRRAVGTSPRKRVKEMRLQMARGLIWMSKLSFKEIASRVGYARMQELSRDYRKKFGLTPTRDREDFPKTYRRVFGLPYTTGSGRD